MLRIDRSDFKSKHFFNSKSSFLFSSTVNRQKFRNPPLVFQYTKIYFFKYKRTITDKNLFSKYLKKRLDSNKRATILIFENKLNTVAGIDMTKKVGNFVVRWLTLFRSHNLPKLLFLLFHIDFWNFQYNCKLLNWFLLKTFDILFLSLFWCTIFYVFAH